MIFNYWSQNANFNIYLRLDISILKCTLITRKYKYIIQYILKYWASPYSLRITIQSASWFIERVNPFFISIHDLTILLTHIIKYHLQTVFVCFGLFLFWRANSISFQKLEGITDFIIRYRSEPKLSKSICEHMHQSQAQWHQMQKQANEFIRHKNYS